MLLFEPKGNQLRGLRAFRICVKRRRRAHRCSSDDGASVVDTDDGRELLRTAFTECDTARRLAT